MKKVILFLVLALSSIGFASDQVFASVRQAAIWESVDNQLIEYADSAFDDGEFARVVSALNFRYQMHPNDEETLTDYGWMLENTSRAGEALSLYIAYRLRNSSSSDACLPEITYYFRKKAFAKIPPIAELEMVRDPSPNLYRMLYRSYEMLNLYADAVRVLDQYIAKFPLDPVAKQNRERILNKMREPQKPSWALSSSR